ncbi:hypothetical protein ROV06_004978 [Serratia marcescens]|nr:hypothetical protein [Serratia marcescens]
MGNLKPPKTAQQLKLAPNEGESDELSLPLSKLPRVKDLKRDALIPVVNDEVTEVTTVEDIAKLGGGVKLDPNVNNLLSNSSDGLLFDRYKTPNVGITGTYVSTSAGPNFTEANAFSETGGVWRVKNTLMLSRVPAKYSGAVIVDISLGKIPCDSSGIPLQYTLSTTTTSKQVSGVWRQHSVMILAVVGSPAKLMDVASGALEDYKEGAAWNVSVKYTFGEMAPSV